MLALGALVALAAILDLGPFGNSGGGPLTKAEFIDRADAICQDAQGMRGARRAIRLRALLRAARGRLRHRGPRSRRREAADSGRLRGHPALLELPAVQRAPARRAVALEPGLTPLVRAERLAESLRIRELWIKNDAGNPTHSFKDRVERPAP